MRIVGGKFRHRNILMTNLETTRETQDKVREAIYNMIGPYFDGGICLDLFAGSGAMGIEAFSRGIEEIHLNDLNAKALDICRINCKSLNISEVQFFNMDYKDFIKNCSYKYDLIILDPPYKLNNIIEILSEILLLIKIGGIVVFEMAKDSKYPSELDSLKLIKDKVYGIKRVVIYRSQL